MHASGILNKNATINSCKLTQLFKDINYKSFYFHNLLCKLTILAYFLFQPDLQDISLSCKIIHGMKCRSACIYTKTDGLTGAFI